MDEYEVDLREYVRILWRGKWIVAGVVAVALAVAAVATWRAPAEYWAEVVLAVEDPVLKPKAYTAPTEAWVVERAKDPAVLERAAKAASVSPQGLAGALTAVKKDAFVELTVRSTHPGAELAAVLDGVVAALREDLAADVARAADGRLTELEAEREKLQARLTAWEEELDRARAATEVSRDRLRAEIARLRDDQALWTLNVGIEATVQGYLVQKELDLLYARFQEAELALDGMERLGPAYVAGAAWKTLDDQLAALEQEDASLRLLLADPPSPLSVVRGVTVSGPFAPSLKMNCAVAGVLGAFVGALLVFFVHALRAPPSGPRGEEQGGGGEG